MKDRFVDEKAECGRNTRPRSAFSWIDDDGFVWMLISYAALGVVGDHACGAGRKLSAAAVLGGLDELLVPQTCFLRPRPLVWTASELQYTCCSSCSECRSASPSSLAHTTRRANSP